MVDFEELRHRFEEGDESALYQAANACRDPTASEVTLPSWALEALVKREVEHMRRLPGKGMGRNPTWAKQHRVDLIHLSRFVEFNRTLLKVRASQEGLAEKQRLSETQMADKAAEQAAAALASGLFSDGLRTGGAILASVKLVNEAREKNPEEFRRRFTFRNPGWMLSRK